MKDIVLVGASGCMRELLWQMQILNKEIPTWNVIGYTDNAPVGTDGIVRVGNEEVAYLGTDDVLIHGTEEVNVAICVGSPKLRKKIAEKLMVNEKIIFPNLILSGTQICEDVVMGQGCIISMDARISTNVSLGDFVFLNTGSMICHDGKVGDFVTLSPDVKVAGAVHIGNHTELGIGAKVIQGITIAEDVTIGAGAVVVRDIDLPCTAVGIPARPIMGNK